jgi:hypothetical protein
MKCAWAALLMFVTLRRAGLFVQFFRDGLIQIKSISVNLAKGDQY